MEFYEITAGLEKLLKANHYNLATIRFYKNEWKKIKLFLSEKYSDSAFDMERGLAYLEEKYHLQTKYNDGTLSQQRVQLLRVVHMLEDYRLHKALTRRFHASKNPIQLKASFNAVLEDYTLYLQNSSLSKSTGSMLLDMETPIPVITSILGHSDIDVTGIYLKTDLQKLRECVLPVEVTAHE